MSNHANKENINIFIGNSNYNINKAQLNPNFQYPQPQPHRSNRYFSKRTPNTTNHVQRQPLQQQVPDDCKCSQSSPVPRPMLSPTRPRTTTTTSLHMQARNTVMIFDWDDTLLASSFLQNRELQQKPQQPQLQKDDDAKTEAPPKDCAQELYQLETIVFEILSTAIKLVGCSNVFIITNAERGWVQLSARAFIPKVLYVLAQCNVISARSQFEEQFPDSAIEWKRRTFQSVLQRVLKIDINISDWCDRKVLMPIENRVYNSSPNITCPTDVHVSRINSNCIANREVHVISIGDSITERVAIHDVCKNIRGCKVWVKSFKLLAVPTIHELVQQLEMIQVNLQKISQMRGHLDYAVQFNSQQ